MTGAASGIGRAVSEELARRGTTVIAADLNQTGVEDAVRLILEGGGRAESAHVDVANRDQVQSLVDDAVSKYGRLDYMFNNAGIGVVGEVRDMEPDHWQRTIDVNLWGVIHGSLAAYKVMVARRGGHIVNTASLAGLVPSPTLAAYSVAKHGVVGLSTSLRAEGAGLGVKVSAVCPGLVRTGLYETITLVNAERDTLVKRIPIKPIDPRQAAQAILRGVERNREIIVFPANAQALWMLTRLSRGVGQWLARQTVKEFRKIRTGPS
ncbi:MAG TPA: SDR family oxidoreductase [Blastocatellia bacterium]